VNSKPNQAEGLFNNALGVAKKLSHTGLEVLNKVGQNQKNSQKPNSQIATENNFPNLSQQLLGRHYANVNKVTNLVAPNLTDKFSDYLFDRLNHFSSHLASVDQVLDEAGVKDLEELTQDVGRSKRLSDALALQNKWLASAQGAFSGATGVIGSALDVPASLLLALRSIYQIGRAYGFELNKETEQDMVQFIFKQVDLSLIAQKQTLLIALKALSSALETHDLNQLQQLLGTQQDAQTLKDWLKDNNGESKFEWLDHLPKISILSKLTPIAGASLSAAYSWKLLEDVNQKAQEIFSEARTYLQQHQELSLSPIAAYEKSREYFLAKQKVGELKLNQELEVVDHATISKVVIQKKALDQADLATPEEEIESGLKKIAQDMVEPQAVQVQQKPALSQTVNFDQADSSNLNDELLDDQAQENTKNK
jgi:hypothetical protein